MDLPYSIVVFIIVGIAVLAALFIPFKVLKSFLSVHARVPGLWLRGFLFGSIMLFFLVFLFILWEEDDEENVLPKKDFGKGVRDVTLYDLFSALAEAFKKADKDAGTADNLMSVKGIMCGYYAGLWVCRCVFFILCHTPFLHSQWQEAFIKVKPLCWKIARQSLITLYHQAKDATSNKPSQSQD